MRCSPPALPLLLLPTPNGEYLPKPVDPLFLIQSTHHQLLRHQAASPNSLRFMGGLPCPAWRLVAVFRWPSHPKTALGVGRRQEKYALLRCGARVAVSAGLSPLLSAVYRLCALSVASAGPRERGTQTRTCSVLAAVRCAAVLVALLRI
jgi:hypothetical protein